RPGGGGRATAARLGDRLPARHPQDRHLQGPCQEPLLHPEAADGPGRGAAAGATDQRDLTPENPERGEPPMSTIATTPRGYIERPRPSGLADVIDVILDKGLVIDAYVRVSLIGIEILTIDARIVVASVDTYLRFAEAVNRLDIAHTDDSKGLPELVEGIEAGG